MEAVFDVSGDVEVMDYLASQEITVEDGQVTLYREITSSGRNVCRVCGVLTPLGVLRETATLLMDVHGQHEGRFLMDPRYHLGFLDESGDERHAQLMEETQKACQAFLDVHRQYARLARENERKQFRMETLKKSLDEIRKARLKPGEDAELEREQQKLRHNGKIIHAVRTAHGCLSAGEEASALTQLKGAMDALSGIAELDPKYASLSERISSAYYELEEAGYEIASMLETNEFDPRRAQQVDQKLELIRHLKKTYGETIEAILEKAGQMQEEYDSLASLDEQLEAVTQQHRKLLLRPSL